MSTKALVFAVIAAVAWGFWGLMIFARMVNAASSRNQSLDQAQRLIGDICAIVGALSLVALALVS